MDSFIIYFISSSCRSLIFCFRSLKPFSFLSELDRTVVSLVRGGITANSRAAYSAAVKKYTAFCRIYSLPPVPVSQSNALRFVAHCTNAGLAVSSIRVYLAGLRSWSIDMGLPPPELYTPQLAQAIKCLDRHYTPLQAPPILHHHLLSIFSRASFNKDNFMSLSALSLAYFACLRPSEYLATRGTAPPPTRAHVTFSRDFLALDFTVPRSKTNPKGFVVHLGCSHSPICPVCLIRALLSLYPAPPSAPLFTSINNHPLSYSYLTNKLHSFLSMTGIHPAPYTLHSLRAGAATTAAAAGCSEDQIQKLGRWSSTCYRRYIRPSTREQAAMAPILTTSLH